MRILQSNNFGNVVMKRLFFLFFMTFITIFGNAQRVCDILSSKAIVFYSMDKNGLYHLGEPTYFEDNCFSIYAFNKKEKKAYALKENGNYELTVTEYYAKILKGRRDIPKLEGEGLSDMVDRKNKELKHKFDCYNYNRNLFIQDSLAKVREDSVQRSKKEAELKIIRDRYEAKLNQYRNTHKWMSVPIEQTTLHCSLCEHSIFLKDVISCVAATEDSLYEVEKDKGSLKAHRYEIPEILAYNSEFLFHMDAFRDSLKQDKLHLIGRTETFNEAHNAKKLAILTKKHGTINAKLIMSGKVKIGWTKAMCKESWGEPDKINTTIGTWGTHEQWVYGDNSYLYFENGKLTTIQN